MISPKHNKCEINTSSLLFLLAYLVKNPFICTSIHLYTCQVYIENEFMPSTSHILVRRTEKVTDLKKTLFSLTD